MTLLKFLLDRGWLKNIYQDESPTLCNLTPNPDHPDPQVFDPQYLLALFDHSDLNLSMQLVAGILKKALELQQERLEKLHQAIHERDAPSVAFVAHQLKGSYASTGSPSLARVCSEIEQVGRQPDWSLIFDYQQKIAALDHYYRKQVAQFIAERAPQLNSPSQ